MDSPADAAAGESNYLLFGLLLTGFNGQELRLSPAIDQQHNRVVSGLPDRLVKLLHVAYRFAIDVLNHVTAPQTCVARRAARLDIRHYYTRHVRRQPKLLRDIGRQVVYRKSAQGRRSPFRRRSATFLVVLGIQSRTLSRSDGEVTRRSIPQHC